MSSEVSVKNRKACKTKVKTVAEAKACALDTRRQLEERLEDRRLEYETEEFDFEY